MSFQRDYDNVKVSLCNFQELYKSYERCDKNISSVFHKLNDITLAIQSVADQLLLLLLPGKPLRQKALSTQCNNVR